MLKESATIFVVKNVLASAAISAMPSASRLSSYTASRPITPASRATMSASISRPPPTRNINAFAHSKHQVDFNNQHIREDCEKLKSLRIYWRLNYRMEPPFAKALQRFAETAFTLC